MKNAHEPATVALSLLKSDQEAYIAAILEGINRAKAFDLSKIIVYRRRATHGQ